MRLCLYVRKKPYLCSTKHKDIAMVTIQFINAKGQGQMTVNDFQKENAINSLLAVGYAILKINK